MSTIKDAITSIATTNGYDGEDPTSIKDALMALTSTLAGEDAGDAETIADAIDALAPYIVKDEAEH